MKKLLALSFAMLFLCAGMAWATDIEVTGSYFAQGSYYDNVQKMPTNNQSDFQEYEHELTFDVTFKIDDTTKVITRVEARDNDWARTDVTEGSIVGDLATEADDGIYLEMVYGSHTFGNGGTLNVGLMSGGGLVWGNKFANNSGENYRVFYSQPTSLGTVIAIAEKNAEAGDATVGEDNDIDTYYLGLVSDWNGISVQPIVAYTIADNTTALNDHEDLILILALAGTMGNIGWEAEVDYVDTDYDAESATVTASTDHKDFQIYGLYANVWMQANALKIGVLGAYGSFDDDAKRGFDSGDDFSAGGALIIGDDIHFDDVDGDTKDLQAPSLIALYADYQVNPKLSVGGYLGYAKCNADVANGDALDLWDGATLTEVSGDVTYAITSNLTYTVAAGFATLEYGDNTVDPDNSVEVNHKLTFTF